MLFCSMLLQFKLKVGSIVSVAPKQDYPNNSRAVIAKPADEDEEFARMMARMDELEKEEREAECQMAQSDEDEQLQHGLHQLSDQKSLHGNLKISEVEMQEKLAKTVAV
ncbi:uncharacterized protein LOC133723932 [Rosa rugosa]|uniref:uncharacterized protein LOC133723932 n=1 Tax=Rosa rugosa TaxID=74645 RepID=UPI002B401B9C|nr:uncharacterized protein LOC133723932 [Rosa rugosa]